MAGSRSHSEFSQPAAFSQPGETGSCNTTGDPCERWTAKFAREWVNSAPEARHSRAKLESLIEREIIPRLFVLSRAETVAADLPVAPASTGGEVPAPVLPSGDTKPATSKPAAAKPSLESAERRLCALLLAENLAEARRSMTRHWAKLNF